MTRGELRVLAAAALLGEGGRGPADMAEALGAADRLISAHDAIHPDRIDRETKAGAPYIIPPRRK